MYRSCNYKAGRTQPRHRYHHESQEERKSGTSYERKNRALSNEIKNARKTQCCRWAGTTFFFFIVYSCDAVPVSLFRNEIPSSLFGSTPSIKQNDYLL